MDDKKLNFLASSDLVVGFRVMLIHSAPRLLRLNITRKHVCAQNLILSWHSIDTITGTTHTHTSQPWIVVAQACFHQQYKCELHDVRPHSRIPLMSWHTAPINTVVTYRWLCAVTRPVPASSCEYVITYEYYECVTACVMRTENARWKCFSNDHIVCFGRFFSFDSILPPERRTAITFASARLVSWQKVCPTFVWMCGVFEACTIFKRIISLLLDVLLFVGVLCV